MADVSNISSALWQRKGEPGDHPPRRALEVALEAFDNPEEGESAPSHVIVILGWGEPGGGSDARFLQAGTFGPFAQTGLAAWVAQEFAKGDSE